MIEFETLKAETVGRWEGIYSNLGINVRDDGKHSACPLCGPGNNKHRFRMDDKNGSGSWICTQCGAGDGVSLVRKFFNLSFPETLEKINGVIGGCDVIKTETQAVDPKIALNKLWSESVELKGDDPVLKYLHSRGLVLRPQNVRFCQNCYEPETKTEMPAMIARIQDSEGRPVSLHRTFLNGEGKADIVNPKKLMPGAGKVSGCAVRLFSLKDPMMLPGVLGIAEGIETALACAQLVKVVVWSCLSNTLLESFQPPPGVKKIIIYSDNDANYAGQKSAYVLANRLYNNDYIVDVEVPDMVGDFNDVLQSEQLAF